MILPAGTVGNYEVVLVEDVLDVELVLVVGPAALPAEAAIAMPAAARPTPAMIRVVLVSRPCALCTPAGLPGASAGLAMALLAQSASDVARQIASFMSNPQKGL